MTAQQAMRTAWQIRRAAAAKYGVKVSEILFAPCLKMAWSQPMATFTATTKTGKQIDITGRPTKQAPSKDGMVWVVVLTPDEVQRELGVTPAASLKEALIVIDDQKGYAAFKMEQARREYEERQASKLSTLAGQREALAKEVYNLYSADNFPGSRAYNAYIAAEKALAVFDAAHPEIAAAVQANLAAETAERLKRVNCFSI